MISLRTRWSDAAAAGETLGEYPRPRMRRDSYLSLNGTWQYAVVRPGTGDAEDRSNANAVRSAFDGATVVSNDVAVVCANEQAAEPVCAGEILVPFAPESLLSGVHHILQPDEVLYYRRTFELPQGFHKGRVLLHLDAVDQICRVWVNDQYVGSHEGGYTAFTLEITDALRDGSNELYVEVRDQTEYAPYGRGKQRLQSAGRFSYLFYTPVSGIWKSVWLESVPAAYIAELRVTPVYDVAAVSVVVTVVGDAGGEVDGSADGVMMDDRVEVLLNGAVVSRQVLEPVHWSEEATAGLGLEPDRLNEAVAARRGQEPRQYKAVLSLPGFHAWTPDNPVLYDLRVRMGDDEVWSYLGMRKIDMQRDVHGILRFYLNNEPIFMHGLLDQGYWPDGLLTAPSDEAYIHDIMTLKGMGYNLIRKHIKVEAERFYYHCDRLGMLVWQDIPNGGGDYNMMFVTVLPNVSNWVCRHIGDHHYSLYARRSEASRQCYYTELEETIAELYHHPSIVAWTPFNEGWGQFDAEQVTRRIRELDGTRLVNQACGWYDQGGGDMYAIHNYWRTLKVTPQTDRVVALTEYGGYALPVPGHMACDHTFGYKDYKSSEELTDAYADLIARDILGNLRNGLSAAIYTQVSDIETEINGLMTYDRAVDKMDAARIREFNEQVYRMFAEAVR